MRKNGIITLGIKGLCVLLMGGIFGTLLLIAVYCLPQSNIKENLSSGVFHIIEETSQFSYAEGYTSAIIDNTTDVIMLEKTAYSSPKCFQDALLVPNYSYPGNDIQGMSLFTYLNGDAKDVETVSYYPRYWHGYLIFLKPLLSIFSFSDLRIMNQIGQLSLILISIFMVCMVEKRLFIPLLPVILFWNPASMGLCLALSPCVYITFGAVIILLYRKIRDIPTTFMGFGLFFFLLVGMVTVYMDFLTFPVATLGIPLVVWVVLFWEEKNNALHTVGLCISWGVGYIGMWFEKWLIASLFSEQNVISDAISSLAERSSAVSDTGESLSRIGTIGYLINHSLIKWPYVLMLLVVIAVFVVLACRVGRRNLWNNVKGNAIQLILLFGIGCLPFAWYFFTANHSYIHPRFTYRALGVTIFAWLTMAYILLPISKD